MSGDVEDPAKKILRLSAELQQAQTERDAFAMRIKETRKAIKDREQELSASQERVRELESQLARERQAASEAAATMLSVVEEKEAGEQDSLLQREGRESQVEGLQAELKRVLAEEEARAEEAREVGRRCTKLELDLGEAVATIDQMRQDMEAATAHAQSQEKKIEKLNAMKEEHKEELNAMKEEHKEELEQVEAALNEERDSKLAKLASLQQEMMALKAELGRSQEEAESKTVGLREELASGRKETEDKVAELAVLQQELSSLRIELKRSREEADSEKAEHCKVQQQCAESEKREGVLRAENERLVAMVLQVKSDQAEFMNDATERELRHQNTSFDRPPDTPQDAPPTAKKDVVLNRAPWKKSGTRKKSNDVMPEGVAK